MKKFSIVIMLLGFSLLLNGCGTSDAKAAVSTALQTKNAEEMVLQTTGENMTQQNREPADFTGEISQLIGNEVTLKLVKMPQMRERTQMQQDGAQQGSISDNNNSQQDKNQPKAITGSTNSGFPGGPGSFPGGGFPGEGGKSSSRSSSGHSSSTAASKTALKLDYTGEEKTITIPVGMGIASGRSQSEATFDSLQTGNILSVWLKEDGTVERARLISGGTQ